MSYRTILLHLNESKAVPADVRFVAPLVNRVDAHLIGLVTETFPSLSQPDLDTQDKMDNMAQKSSRFEVFCEKYAVNSFEAKSTTGDPIDSLIQHARCSDLVALNQPPVHLNIQRDRRIVENVLLNAGKPCLFIPYIGTMEGFGKRVIVAWDGSREASRAIADAMPLLRAADSVEVVIINGSATSNADSMVDVEIGVYLARQSVNVEVKEIASNIDVGNTLLSHAVDYSADLCVMGAYGHSRVREWIWGGATRTILESMTVPVFMSH